MTREQMIELLTGTWAAIPEERKLIAAHFQADGETIARLTEERKSHKHEAAIHRFAMAQLKETTELLVQCTAERDAARAPPPAAAALWKNIIGDAYTRTTWGRYEAIHPTRISQAMRIAQQRAPECADSIAMLIWWRVLDAQTAAAVQQSNAVEIGELKLVIESQDLRLKQFAEERDAALARVAELEAEAEDLDAMHRSAPEGTP